MNNNLLKYQTKSLLCLRTNKVQSVLITHGNHFKETKHKKKVTLQPIAYLLRRQLGEDHEQGSFTDDRQRKGYIQS